MPIEFVHRTCRTKILIAEIELFEFKHKKSFTRLWCFFSKNCVIQYSTDSQKTLTYSKNVFYHTKNIKKNVIKKTLKNGNLTKNKDYFPKIYINYEIVHIQKILKRK